MVITRYKAKGPKLKAAVVADLHGKPTEELSTALKETKPDIILIPGDLITVGEYKDRPTDHMKREEQLQVQKKAMAFLREAVTIAPVFYSRGNHEWGVDDVYRAIVKSTGAVFLENEWFKFGDVWIGGLTSAKCYGLEELGEEDQKPDTEWLKDSPGEGYKILLCHHPEYYPLVHTYADLIISGHTHGGQWRFCGKGVFAPGQGFFPKYSKGLYDGKLVISAGLTNTTKIPRLFNPTELVIVEMGF